MVSDFLTGLEYFEGQSFTESVRYLNNTKVTNVTSSYFLNATARICHLDSEVNGTYNFSCVEHHYWYGIMTFVFIYATSGMTLAALIGRGAAYFLCVSWGIIFGIVGLILTYTGESVEIVLQGLFMIFLGTILFWGPVLSFVLGLADKSMAETYAKNKSNRDSAMIGTLFFFIPLVILVSPVMMLIIHTLAIFRPESRFIKAQKKEVKKGESILEATPQLILQMFVAMKTMHPSWKQQASIITSCLSICIADAESYLDKKYGIEFGLNMTSLKCFLAHVPSSIFNVLAFSIFIVFFELMSIPIWVGYFLVSAVFSSVLRQPGHDLQKKWEKFNQEPEDSKITFAYYRQHIRDFSLIFYGIIFTCTGFVCNFSAGSAVIKTGINDITWSQLALVQNIFYLNLILGLTMLTGVGSMALEIFIAWYNQDEDGWGWKSTYFHQPLQNLEEQTERKDMEDIEL